MRVSAEAQRERERERETTPVCRRSVKGTGRPVSHVGPVPPAATGWQCWRSEFSDRAHSNCCGNDTPLTTALAAASSRLSCARWRTISPSAASPAAPGRVPGGVGPTTPAPSDRQDRWCPLSRIQPRGSRAETLHPVTHTIDMGPGDGRAGMPRVPQGRVTPAPAPKRARTAPNDGPGPLEQPPQNSPHEQP